MKLADKIFTVGDMRQFYVDYSAWLRKGTWLVSATVTTNSSDVSVSEVSVIDPSRVTFFLSGGEVNEDFTATIVITCSNTEVSNDTIDFHVVAP